MRTGPLDGWMPDPPTPTHAAISWPQSVQPHALTAEVEACSRLGCGPTHSSHRFWLSIESTGIDRADMTSWSLGSIRRVPTWETHQRCRTYGGLRITSGPEASALSTWEGVSDLAISLI